MKHEIVVALADLGKMVPSTVSLHRVGVLTSGGDAQGMNAAVRAVTLRKSEFTRRSGTGISRKRIPHSKIENAIQPISSSMAAPPAMPRTMAGKINSITRPTMISAVRSVMPTTVPSAASTSSRLVVFGGRSMTALVTAVCLVVYYCYVSCRHICNTLNRNRCRV
mgnify:CR=1 FL=1